MYFCVVITLKSFGIVLAAKLEWVQVYGNIQNLFTICGYDGYDPEIGSNGQSVILQGIDNYRYPSQRIYTVGLKVKF